MADQARVYALLDPAALVSEREAITTAVFRLLGILDPAAHVFAVSESSGWLTYQAKEELWNRRTPPVLPSAAEAQRRAETFIANVTAATSPGSAQWPQSLANVSLLPRLMRPVQLSAVPRPDAEAWDHWLYRAQPRLALDPSGRVTVPVFGSQIEIRIGDRGQIVSFRARWRPLSGERITTELRPFVPPPSDEGAQSDRRQQPPHALQYVLDGETIPQFYLAPYYVTGDEHVLTTVSACPWALTVRFGRVQGAESMLITALAEGGSGDYAYNWAAYRLDQVDEGFLELGSGQTVEVDTDTGTALISAIEIENGAYVMLLNVRDRATGAFKHEQQTVMSTLYIEPRAAGPAAVPVA